MSGSTDPAPHREATKNKQNPRIQWPLNDWIQSLMRFMIHSCHLSRSSFQIILPIWKKLISHLCYSVFSLVIAWHPATACWATWFLSMIYLSICKASATRSYFCRVSSFCWMDDLSQYAQINSSRWCHISYRWGDKLSSVLPFRGYLNGSGLANHIVAFLIVTIRKTKLQ